MNEHEERHHDFNLLYTRHWSGRGVRLTRPRWDRTPFLHHSDREFVGSVGVPFAARCFSYEFVSESDFLAPVRIVHGFEGERQVVRVAEGPGCAAYLLTEGGTGVFARLTGVSWSPSPALRFASSLRAFLIMLTLADMLRADIFLPTSGRLRHGSGHARARVRACFKELKQFDPWPFLEENNAWMMFVEHFTQDF